MPEAAETAAFSARRKRRRGPWAWIGISSLIGLVTFLIVAEVMIERAGPILKGRVIETLSTRFNSRVEIDGFQVSVLRGLEISGDRLRIFPPDPVVAAGATQPLIAIDHFTFHSGFMGLIFKPMRLAAVHVSGLHINIPPSELRAKGHRDQGRKGKIKIVVEDIICRSSQLVI